MERGWARNACAWKSHAEDAAAVVGAVAAAIWTGVTADVTSLAGIATGAHMATVAVTTIAEGGIHQYPFIQLIFSTFKVGFRLGGGVGLGVKNF